MTDLTQCQPPAPEKITEMREGVKRILIEGGCTLHDAKGIYLYLLMEIALTVHEDNIEGAVEECGGYGAEMVQSLCAAERKRKSPIIESGPKIVIPAGSKTH